VFSGFFSLWPWPRAGANLFNRRFYRLAGRAVPRYRAQGAQGRTGASICVFGFGRRLAGFPHPPTDRLFCRSPRSAVSACGCSEGFRRSWFSPLFTQRDISDLGRKRFRLILVRFYEGRTRRILSSPRSLPLLLSRALELSSLELSLVCDNKHL
jgi:hypothetical protein